MFKFQCTEIKVQIYTRNSAWSQTFQTCSSNKTQTNIYYSAKSGLTFGHSKLINVVISTHLTKPHTSDVLSDMFQNTQASIDCQKDALSNISFCFSLVDEQTRSGLSIQQSCYLNSSLTSYFIVQYWRPRRSAAPLMEWNQILWKGGSNFSGFLVGYNSRSFRLVWGCLII
jgi:hypothetical protein